MLMKVLMIYCTRFGYRPTIKTLESTPDRDQGYEFQDIQTAFIQVEESDEEREREVIKKLLKNLKWVCGKNKTRKIVLHSFAHLSESKAPPEYTGSLFNQVQERLENTNYEVYQTPFGYFLDLEVVAPGFSLARVFKSL